MAVGEMLLVVCRHPCCRSYSGFLRQLFSSPADFHLQLLSCSVGQWIKELRVAGADGTRREGLEPLFSSWSLVPLGWMQQCDQSCQPCSDEGFDKADSHTLATLPCLSASLPPHEFLHALYFGIFLRVITFQALLTVHL